MTRSRATRVLPGLVVVGTVALACGIFAPRASAGYRGYKVAIPSVGGGQDNPQNVDIIENLGEMVPRDLRFVDGHGVRVKLADLLGQGKPVLVTMGYFSCPLLCNLTHEGLAKAIKQADVKLGRDFLGLSVSVDPNEDPKSANTNQGRLLRNIDVDFLAKPDRGAAVKNQWPFVMDARGAAGTVPPVAVGVTTTPTPPDGKPVPHSKQLADKLGFRYFYDAQSKQFAHTAAAFVLTPEGKIARYLYGVDFSARDLRMALVEAGGGRVGTTIDKILLTCFKYDPMTKKYTPFVAGFVRIGAFMSFLALAALMGSLWWKELQMRKILRKQSKVPA